MKVTGSKIFIENEVLDNVKDILRNLGNYYIENDIQIKAIKRHKLARAGNCGIAFKVCHFEPVFDEKYNVVGLEYDENALEYDVMIIFDAIKHFVKSGSYIEVKQNDGNSFVISFINGDCIKLNDLSEIEMLSGRKKEVIFCKECMTYKDGCCVQKTKDDLEVAFYRNPNDYCSRARKNTESEE